MAAFSDRAEKLLQTCSDYLCFGLLSKCIRKSEIVPRDEHPVSGRFAAPAHLLHLGQDTAINKCLN